MNKKFLSLVLALVMVLGTLTPVFAEEQASKEKIEKAAKTDPSAKVQWLKDEKIVTGRKLFKDGKEDTDLSLDKNLQRDEVTRLLVLGKGLENLAKLVQGTMKPYVDVDNANWANGVITVGSYHLKNKQGVPMLAGYPGNKFLPTRNVSYAELAKMLVVLVDNNLTPAMVAKAQWPSDWMIWAANKGILAGVEVKNTNDFVTRQAAFEMLYNALYLYDTAHHVDYGTKFGVVSGYANGELRLNQGDKAFTVKLNASTVYVNNSGFVGQNALKLWKENTGLYIGSLVRVIADKDGNATHIVELGNPDMGPIGSHADRWYGVADKQLAGFADFAKKNVEDGSTIVVYDGTFMSANRAYEYQDKKQAERQAQFNLAIVGNKKTEVRLTKETKYFVADARKNYLTEVTKAKAQELVNKAAYEDKLGFFPNVYVGYDEAKRGDKVVDTEARVVVFNVVNKEFSKGTLTRVTQPSNSAFAFRGENTKGEVTMFNLRNFARSMAGFDRPEFGTTNTAGYYKEFEKLNVVKVFTGMDDKDVLKAEVIIKYADAPSFQVVKVYEGRNPGYYTVDLKGKDGRVLPRVLVSIYDTSIFNADQWAKVEGKWIQVEGKNLAKNAAGEYSIKDFKITGAVSVLENDHNWAKVDPRFGQDANLRLVTIYDRAEQAPSGSYRINANNVKFNTPEDEVARVQIANANGFYYISKEDADYIEETLYQNNAGRLIRKVDAIDGNNLEVASATFEATVVPVSNGRLPELDINNNVAPKKAYKATEMVRINLPKVTEVKNLAVLTQDEKDTVKKAVEDVNKHLVGAVVTVANDGGVTIAFGGKNYTIDKSKTVTLKPVDVAQ